ncbi:hypothetical protein [Agrobacterium tumefaciens]|nr:hypothetical protein [Agrobacterium tumefaciens]UXS66661.1 hypothetical protein FY147_27420 [Agrobacterium tumefaciens]
MLLLDRRRAAAAETTAMTLPGSLQAPALKGLDCVGQNLENIGYQPD